MIISCFIGVCVLLFGPLVSSACNVTLYAQGEPLNFTSPNYPGNYTSNDNCYWDIYPQTRGYSVILDMVFSDIESSSRSNCPYDALTIYVKNNGDQRIGESKRICGQSRLNIITREDQHIHAVFETDGSVTRGGFLIRYYETDGHSCGLSDLSASSVAWTNLTSPGYPSNYSNNLNCQWTISASVGYEIKVEVVYFNVEYSTACSSDYLLFSDGSTSFAAQLGKYCGRSYITRVVVSSRNYMTITFHTDDSDTALGFNLKYKAGTFLTTTTEITNGLNCGSRLLRASTSTWGHLSSPGYPNHNYRDNMDCRWTVSAPAGYKIKVEIIVLSVEFEATCAFDYLLFSDGSSSFATRLGKYCYGTRNVVSSSNAMTITFHTDGSRTDRGFSLKYMARTSGASGVNCGSSLLSASTSTWTYLSSPGYPNYNNNMDCKWTISAPAGYKIKAEIIALSLEYEATCARDYLLFSDGSSPYDTKLGKYCTGTRDVVSSSNAMTITFHTDGSVTGRGFSLKYMARTSVSGCGTDEEINEYETKYIESPNYPLQYPSNANCSWTISNRLEGYVIHVQVVDFNLEPHNPCSYDYVQLYDVTGTYERSLGRWCGSDGPDTQSTGMSMKVRFLSDSSNTFKGFKLAFTACEPTSSCARGLNCGSSLPSASTSTWRYLSSPGYPNYNNNMECKWTISAPAGYKIKAEIIALSLEYEATCARDYLRFSDGSSSYDTKLGKYCNGTRDVVSSSNVMTITFHTDGSVTGRGFSLKYMARTSGCGTDEEINEYETNYIESPNYPLQYPSNADCSWTISTRLEGYVIHVEVVDFYLEPHSSCSYDYVQLYDVTGTDERSLGRWCGSNGPDTQSTGMSMKVRFLSDSSNTLKGFKLAFTAVEPTSSRCGTDEKINEYETKYIESPNYPLQYPSNANCSWTISTRLEGYVIQVQVVDFYLEPHSSCFYDYVQLYYVTGTYERSLGRWCGLDGPDPQSAGMSMKVRFHSDSSSTFKGFKLAFTACEPTSSSSVSPNLGGIIGGVFGGIVGVAIVTCCCCGICSRKKSTTNDQSQGNRSREVNLNTVYTVPVSNYPPTTATTQPAMFTPPPAYSEVVKDDPPPYCQAVPLSDILPLVTSSPNGASSYQGTDNPAGPS
ncbi:cubilin-like isoform X3 [Haliotis rufescens]|uniref:cubilin-like isoform X3 n=1 Tax=Haliotis rufescens TaxID=6454 RepID=UPI00201F8AF8|nr:cubilin-like isoform X3 [Haliotis rufescens]